MSTDVWADTFKLALAQMRAVAENQGDTEACHAEADRILRQFVLTLGYGELVNEYDRIDKWFA